MAERLREVLTALDARPVDLARAYNVSPQRVYQLLRNKGIPNKLSAWLANTLGINLNWLFTGKGPMFAPPEGIRLAEPQPVYQGEANEQILIEMAHQLGEEGRPFIEAVARRRLREAVDQNALTTEGDQSDE